MKSAIIAAAVAEASARFSLGGCPKNLHNVQTLDKDRYAGMWYEIEKDIMFPMAIGAECTYKKFTVDSNDDLNLWFGAYSWPKLSYSGVGGKMYCTPGDKDTCEATMTPTGDHRVPFPVLATDYDTYDIGYSCFELVEGFVKADFIMIYGREKTMSP